MTYIPTEDIKKDIVNYLEKSINSNIFDFKHLSFESIVTSFKDIPKKKIEKALDGLINDGEISQLQSDLKVYVPNELKNHENLKALKLGNPFKVVVYTYIIGLFAIELFIMLSSYFNKLIATFYFLKPDNIIPNSVVLGTILPLAIGSILRLVYLGISKPMSNIGVNKGALIAIISCAFIFLFIYIVLASYLQKPFESTFIMGSLTSGLTFGGLFYSLVLRKQRESVKLL
jgi:hypothetical protein